MARITSQFKQLSKLVARLPGYRRGEIIGVEGFVGSGKTTLGKKLADSLAVECVSTDKFVLIHGGCFSYIGRISKKRLLRALTVAGERGRPVLLEGICLRVVARQLRCFPMNFVYIKRMSGNIWHDGFHLEDFVAGVVVPNDALHEPHLSDLRYHARFVPHKRADIIFERQEQSG